jgi:L-fuculose-phosphate aldolase
MDVSDGLARDLPRLLGGLGADLDFDAAIIPPEVTAAAPFMGMAAEDIFLLGGEDYALAGACSGRMWTGLTQAMPEARLIGRVRPEAGLFLRGKRLDLEGFDHFSPHQGPRGGGAENAAETTAFSTASSVGGRAWPPLPRPARKAMAALVACGREAWRAGLMAGFNGNISCRVTLEDGSQACLITRSGAAKARLGENDFSLLSLPDGKAIQGPPPSTESPVHLGIYRACPRSAAVLHIHPPKLLALSLTLPKEQRLDLPLPEAESCRVRLAFTPYYAPGSSELGLEAAGAAAEHPAIWLERHGLVTHGSDLAFALSLAEELEQLAGVQLEMLRTPKQKTALP